MKKTCALKRAIGFVQRQIAAFTIFFSREVQFEMVKFIKFLEKGILEIRQTIWNKIRFATTKLVHKILHRKFVFEGSLKDEEVIDSLIDGVSMQET